MERGEVTLDTTVGEILDDADMSTSDITLKELATHTSGLPRILGISAFAVAISMQRKQNPYDGFTTQRILDEARTAPPQTAERTTTPILEWLYSDTCWRSGLEQPTRSLLKNASSLPLA